MIADRMIGKMNDVLGGIATCAITLSFALASSAAAAATSNTSNTSNTSDADLDLYIEYSAGASFVRNQNLTGADISGSTLAGNYESTTGFNLGGAFGKRFLEHFRAEIQLTYRENEVENLSVQGENDTASGDVGMLAIMTNGYFDYDLGIGVIPYVGAGIGWGLVMLNANNTPGATTVRIDSRDSVFAWSLMAGGSIPINEVVDLSLGYRYIATTDSNFNSAVSNLGGRKLDSEFDAHEVVFGLRFNF